MSYLTRAYGAAKLALHANAPTIMVATGVVAMGAAAVTAGKQTLKVEEVLSKHTPDLEKIKKGEGLFLEGYNQKDAAQDRGKVYGRAAYDLGKLYFVPGVLFIGGATLVFGGHRIMLKRNATLALAFTGLKKTFDAYRARVVESFGPEADQAMYGGSFTRETGTGKNLTIENSRDWETAGLDPYNRVFEQGVSDEWVNDLGCNKMFLGQQQRYAQEKLNRQGHLYLSDVYKALGFAESDISRVVGWKVRRNPDGSKDFPMVDFGFDKPMPDDWTYSKENAIYLDFNCQGLIVGGKLQKLLEQA